MPIPFHVGVSVSIAEQLVQFACPVCRLEAQAFVRSEGTAFKVNAVPLGSAEVDAHLGAARAVRLLPCPRCGHRSGAALLGLLPGGGLLGIIAAMAAAFSGAELLRGFASEAQVALACGAGTFFMVVWGWVALKLWQARRRVRFHGQWK